MAEKIGVYIAGLGQSFQQESVEKYATRFKNELSFNSSGSSFEIKTEKINYSEEKESTLVTTIATEFACVDNYIQYGEQSQIVLGNLDLLIEYIAETEKDAKIHIHSYSLGSILAIDLLFPLGNVPSNNTKNLVDLLVTIGTPYEFIKAYYPYFYGRRCLEIEDKIQWLNIYSTTDALATNFRRDVKVGESQFGIIGSTLKPFNINYEIAPAPKFNLINFFSFHHIRAHNHYWDSSTQGQSCMRMLFNKMKENNFI